MMTQWRIYCKKSVWQTDILLGDDLVHLFDIKCELHENHIWLLRGASHMYVISTLCSPQGHLGKNFCPSALLGMALRQGCKPVMVRPWHACGLICVDVRCTSHTGHVMLILSMHKVIPGVRHTQTVFPGWPCGLQRGVLRACGMHLARIICGTDRRTDGRTDTNKFWTRFLSDKTSK